MTRKRLVQASQTEFPSLLGPCPIARKDCRARPAHASAAPDSMRDAHNSYTQSRGIPNNRVGHYPDRHTSRPTGAPATTSHRYRHCTPLVASGYRTGAPRRWCVDLTHASRRHAPAARPGAPHRAPDERLSVACLTRSGMPRTTNHG